MRYEKEIHQSGNRESCFRTRDNYNNADRSVRNRITNDVLRRDNCTVDNNEETGDDVAADDDDDVAVYDDVLLYDVETVVRNDNHVAPCALSYDDVRYSIL